MNKAISMRIRVSEDKLNMLKQEAGLRYMLHITSLLEE